MGLHACGDMCAVMYTLGVEKNKKGRQKFWTLLYQALDRHFQYHFLNLITWGENFAEWSQASWAVVHIWSRCIFVYKTPISGCGFSKDHMGNPLFWRHSYVWMCFQNFVYENYCLGGGIENIFWTVFELKLVWHSENQKQKNRLVAKKQIPYKKSQILFSFVFS